MPAISRRRALAYALVLLAVLALAGSYALRRDPPAQRPLPAAALAAEPAPARKLVVHVVGAVREPGLYRLREGSRVDDAIQRAGGPKPKAALELVNLASPVADGQQVVVPVRGSAGATIAGSPGASGTTGGIVHLNSATLEDLDTLPGVGPVTAQKILDYRTANGAFSSVEELDAVPGIGPATLEELRPLVGL
ncbi:MAG: helix-hairpin-helix domain-containing protein [Gaiellaceae bacterium]